MICCGIEVVVVGVVVVCDIGCGVFVVIEVDDVVLQIVVELFFVVEVGCILEISVVGEVFVIIREEDIFCVFIGIEEEIILEKIR